VKIELQRIAAEEARKKTAAEARQVTLASALDQWMGEMKTQRDTSLETYSSTTRRILRWAEKQKITSVDEITAAMLDQWLSAWKPDAADKENRLASQAALLTRVKAFFTWATAIEFTTKNPTLLLKAIKPDKSETMPLTPAEFEEAMKTTYTFDGQSRYNAQKVGEFLRAIFLVQRWYWLANRHVLQLPKAALQGNRIRLSMQKTAGAIQCVLPDHVVTVLRSPAPTRAGTLRLLLLVPKVPCPGQHKQMGAQGEAVEQLSVAQERGRKADAFPHAHAARHLRGRNAAGWCSPGKGLKVNR
jgi:hypothetical protein